MISAGIDGSLRRWDLREQRHPSFIQQGNSTVSSCFSADGDDIFALNTEGKLTIFDSQSGEGKGFVESVRDKPISSIAIDREGKRLLILFQDKSLQILDAMDFLEIAYLDNVSIGSREPQCIAVCSHNPWIAIGDNKTIHVFDYQLATVVASWVAHEFAVGKMQFSPDGKRLYSSSISGKNGLKVWNTQDWSELKSLGGRSQTSGLIDLSGDGKLLLTHGKSNEIKLWNTETLQIAQTFSIDGTSPYCAAINPSGTRFVVSGQSDQKIRVYDATRGKEVIVLPVPSSQGIIRSLKFDRTGDRLLGDSFGPRFVWNGSKLTESEEQLVADVKADPTLSKTVQPKPMTDIPADGSSAVLSGHLFDVNCLSYSPDGRRLASGSKDETIRIWDVQTGKELNVFVGHEDYITDVSFSPNGKWLASASESKSVMLWDVDGGPPTREFKGHSSEVLDVEFGKDGKLIVSGSRDSVIKAWDIETGRQQWSHKVADKGAVVGISIIPEDSRIAVATGFSSAISIRDPKTGREEQSFREGSESISKFAFSPNGSKIAICAVNKRIEMWDVKSQSIVWEYSAAKTVNSLSFLPDGKRLLVYSPQEQTATILDASNGKEIRSLKLGIAVAVAIRPDGKQLATASFKGNVIQVWNLDQ
jgi:WD40 repeat protein